MSKLKKYLIYAAVAIVTFIIVVLCMFLIDKNKANKMVKDFNKAYNGSEKRVVLYASAKCHYCSIEKPIVKQIAKDYDLDIVMLDVSMLTKKQVDDILDKLNIEGATPTTAIVQNKKVLSTHVGYMDGQDYVDYLVSNGILKEGSKYKPEDNLIFINYDELHKLKDGIVIFGYTSNTNCLDLKATMNKISKKYDVDIYYYNFAKLNEEEFYDSFDYIDELNANDLEIYEGDSFVYPTMVILKDGKIDKVIKETKEDKIVKALGL